MTIKPLNLHVHLKPISWLKYSREGDLLFASSKDQSVSVWYTHNGQLLGTFKHSGAVNCIDVNAACTRLLCASADMKVTLWDVQTGAQLLSVDFATPTKVVQFSEGDKQFLAVTDSSFKQTPSIQIFKLPEEGTESRSGKLIPSRKIEQKDKITSAAWGPLNKTIICGFDDGTIRTFDAESGKQLGSTREHTHTVVRLSFSKDRMLFMSASTDKTAKLFESQTLELLKVYKHSDPVNTAAISPIKRHVILGGGTAAQDVTTTVKKQTYFDTHFFHQVFEEEIGTVRGHFGPIHFLAFSPDGKSYASGGEDGYVRLYQLDRQYLSMEDTPEVGLDEE
ncbi:predicted protein [Naegleria gruberi]|uniref:Eukaryotic translation initiation factor 3 subunit I n=1 Tax=Naegleria gruberi TaxID=5762 RepID=D2W0P9_NAEGR|nr:uncharacterized protein NAEGRDRAFT_74937 [Naegleria gruberi]EFC37372.1 predicted protein [Naegleria gruberi]|eukprot:XP_002670116.1 predicted protein [Naegleria gruberi strain NEG-M]